MAAVQMVTVAVQADSFYIDQNGKRYLCEQVSGGGNSCWEQCPYGFSSCADRCGGGNQCWDRCPYGFSSCAESCGSNGLTPNVLKRILNTQAERLQYEREHLQTQ